MIAFIVEVPELPGCIAGGAAYDKAVVNAKVIIKEWIEVASQKERPIPQSMGQLAYA